MPNRLACWIGRHTWVKHVEQGESYTVCEVCGKSPRGRKGQWSTHGRGIDEVLPHEKEHANR